MPCVFPILSLKALSLARAGGGRGRARARRWPIPPARSRHPRARRAPARPPAGRDGGGLGVPAPGPAHDPAPAAAGGGDRAQPAGLFELAGAGRRRARPAGSFWTGALAAFVATPCTGPFMGAALGAALLLPLAGRCWCSPGSASASRCRSWRWRFIPRLRGDAAAGPAAWMRRLQRFLAMPMARDRCGLPVAAGAAGGRPRLAVRAVRGRRACRLPLFRRADPARGRGRPRSSRRCSRWSWSCRGCAACRPPRLHAAPPLGRRAVQRGRPTATLAAGPPGLRLFHRRLVPHLQGQRGRGDRPRKRFATRSAKRGVKVLVGDWTRGDPAIGRFLEAQGRAGVPFYLWYAPGQPPEELPQLLDARRCLLPALGQRRARRAALPDLLAGHPGLQHLRLAPSPAGRRRRMSRSMKMKSAHLPGSSVPSRSSAKPA